MNQINKIEFRRINRISPSQFFSMKNCAYKSLLAEAFDKRPLLPISANAYFGIVIHKMLELISKRIVISEDDFNRIFDEQIVLVERDIHHQGYDFFVPLQKNVKDFGIKKILLKKHLRDEFLYPSEKSFVKYYSEKWFESKDKIIGGKIDLIIEAGEEVEIIDFKSGAITKDFLDDTGDTYTDIKEEYKDQLKLYAYLYYENTGRFPTVLSLVDLAKQKFKVSFIQSECKSIFDESKIILQSTNDSISKGTFAANPTEVNCKYCLYRPACSFFRQIINDFSFNDVSGSVKNVVRYQNGNVTVFLESGSRQLTVTRFSSEKFEDLNAYRNKQIGIFNLRKEATEFVYSATKTTMIYE